MSFFFPDEQIGGYKASKQHVALARNAFAALEEEECENEEENKKKKQSQLVKKKGEADGLLSSSNAGHSNAEGSRSLKSQKEQGDFKAKNKKEDEGVF